ncbi:hypothetical protein [Leptospirillum ferriphilum]|jgi:hypothetical protein|uniref:MetA-pathway of phenol degradation n=4 Tax=Leptospirillum TaxID=179 RepID=A0A2I2MHE3_9BACT|nr:hypothetical protein [Leptospirillum ferriphilum]EDZ38266.1 MAG: Conserved hypothetical protein [Leptospirillum sp. Group II '5-way CG']
MKRSCRLFLCFCFLVLFRQVFLGDTSCLADPPAMPPDASGSPFAFPFSSDADMAGDFKALAPPLLPWGPNTSGPFFTGTAEVEPIGSWYLEPFAYDFMSPGVSNLSMPMRLAVGLGHNLELDTYLPLEQNWVGPPQTPAGHSASYFGVGNTHFEVKWQLTSDGDVYLPLAMPAIALSFDFWVPSGQYQNLNPQDFSADQLGNGTFNEGVFVLVRKHVKPFMFYLQVGDIVENPSTVGVGYEFNNSISLNQTPNFHMVDGNLLYYAGAFEHVLNTEWGAGYLLEFYGESQSGQNLFFGAANAPPFSFLWLAPEVEVTWPHDKAFSVTWGAGVALPVYQSDYPVTVTPMGTVTFYFNGPFGYRGM